MDLKQRIRQEWQAHACTHTHTLEESLEHSLLFINLAMKKVCKSNYPHYLWKILNDWNWKDDEIRK